MVDEKGQTPKNVKHTGLFIETESSHIGRFTVIKGEYVENPNTKRKVHKPGLQLTTIWGEGTKGFLYLKRMPDSQIAIARQHFGEEWFDKLCECCQGLHGLLEIEDTPETMKAFEEAMRPVDPQATGARSVGQKLQHSKPTFVINVTPINQAG